MAPRIRSDAIPSRRKKSEALAPPSADTLRILAWDLWEGGPMYAGRLQTVARVISQQKPSAVILRGLSQDGIHLMQKTQMWKRLQLRAAGLPLDPQEAPAIALLTPRTTEISDISLFSATGGAEPGVTFRISIGCNSSVVLAVDGCRLKRPPVEVAAPDNTIASVGDYVRWASSSPDRVYVTNRCAFLPGDGVFGALDNRCFDAWLT